MVCPASSCFMADDSTKISATHEVRNPRRNSIISIPDSPDNGKTMIPPLRRASVGSSHVGGNPRRNSTGKPTSQNSGENIIPNHLRASTGSCHDMCKYGRKNANEVKPWKIKPKRPVASSSEEISNINVVVADKKNTKMVKLNKPSPESSEVIKQNNTSVVPGERKKTTMVKLKLSPEPPEVIKRNTTTVVTRERKKTTVVKLEPSPDPPKVTKQNNVAVVPREKKKKAMVKLEPSSEPPEVNKKSYTTFVPGERKKAAMGKLKSSLEPPEVIKREILLTSKKAELSTKQDSLFGRKIIDQDLKMSAKRLPPLKLKAAPSFADASVGSNGRRKSDIKTEMGKKPKPIKTVVKNVLVIPTVSLSPKSPFSRALSLKARKGRNLKQVSPFKDQSQLPKAEPMELCNDKVHEKTLHIVESETGNKTVGIVQSFPGSQSSSFLEQYDIDYSVYTNSEDDDDDYISENDEIINPCGKEILLGDDKRSPRKGKLKFPEEKDGAAVKLKFRRGRIIDVQSEKNSPRRLRFRRGKVFGDGDDQSGSRRRTYKKKDDEETKDSSRLGADKVVLKHQEVVEKKDLQGLFNNVIEETASKLVETRKSKVKALVGAFETVISLQDSKQTSRQTSPEWQFVKHL